MNYQVPVYLYQIEPIQGCTRRCEFCGINNLSKEEIIPFKYMSLELAEKISKEIALYSKPNIRIDFAVHGEPLLHPKPFELISIFRKNVPKAQISIISNGDVLKSKDDIYVQNLFKSGLNYLHVDFYDDRFKEKILNVIEASNITIKDFYKDNINVWSYVGYKQQTIIVCDDISENNGIKKTREIHTAGGNLKEDLYDKCNIDKNKFPLYSRCAKPFREFTINYDGNVSLCCEDWQRKYIIGNVNEETIKDIWENEKFHKARWILYNKRRDMILICKYCNERSFRTGLLKPTKKYDFIKEKIGDRKYLWD